MDAAVPLEVEAKLLAPRESALRAIARLRALGMHRLQPRDSVRLHSIYLDTADLTLAEANVALRLRRHGRDWEATAKWGGQVSGTVHERPELTVPLPGTPELPFSLPSGPLRLRLSALVAGRPLHPILISDIRRRRIDVFTAGAADDQQSVAEMALDRVHLHAPNDDEAAMSYYEVEIERTHGTQRDITLLARLLSERYDLHPSGESKFARGMALLYGPERLAPRQPQPVLIGDSVEEAVRKIVGRHLARLREHDPGTRLGEDPEAVHNMRVATRRLRAAVRTFEAGMSQRMRKHLRAELKWLAQLLGGVRDLDVQLGLLQQYAGGAPPNHAPGLTTFREHLDAERTRRRTELLEALDAQRYFDLLLQLEHLSGSRPSRRSAAHEPVSAAGWRELDRIFRRVLKYGREVGDVPAPEDLHALRIQAKRLRYLLEFLEEITGKPGRRLIKHLVRLQDLLGAHNDAVVTARFVQRYVDGAGAQSGPPTVLALGALMGAQLRLAADLRADFRKTWRRFSRRRTLDDLGAVQRKLCDQSSAAAPAQAVPEQ